MLNKPIENLKIAVLLPAYKRREYTWRCLRALEDAQSYKNTTFYFCDDGSEDGTIDLLMEAKFSDVIVKRNLTNQGLRNTIIDFFDFVNAREFDIIAKMDNDSFVPDGWLDKILKVFEKSPSDILSPNVMPSNAAFKYGEDDLVGYGYRPSKIVGGLWVMKADLIKDITFDRHDVLGLTGAFNLLQQIILEKEPVVGWVPNVIVQDVGHWSGNHPDHIKSPEHKEYSYEVNRRVSW